MKTVHIKYFADNQATELITDYDTKETATDESLRLRKMTA